MGNQAHHHNATNGGPQLAVVAAPGVQGHPMNMGMNMQPMPPASHHSHSHQVGHMVMSNAPMHPPGTPQGQNGLISGVNPNPQMMVGPNGIPQGGIPLMNSRGGPAQSQVSVHIKLNQIKLAHFCFFLRLHIHNRFSLFLIDE